MNNKLNKKNLINLAILFLIIATSVIVSVLPVSLGQIAYALNNAYNKSIGDSLTFQEWNFLDDDFVWKEGDTMTGPLDMGTHGITNVATPAAGNLDYAATVSYVNSNLGSGGAFSRTGATLNVICGQTTLGSTGWIQGAGFVYADIDTRNGGTANFTGSPVGSPYYMVSLGGSNHMWDAVSLSTRFPTPNGFRIYVETNRSAIDVETNLWHINWCGVGN